MTHLPDQQGEKEYSEPQQQRQHHRKIEQQSWNIGTESRLAPLRRRGIMFALEKIIS
jgi:hypothetical protein